MRKIGGHVSTAGGLTTAIKNTIEIGGNCLQIFAGSPRLWARRFYSDAEANLFHAEVTRLSLDPVFIHALYLINLGTDQAGLLDKSVTSLEFDLKNAAAIGAVGVIVHLGSHQGRGFDSVLAQMVESIKHLLIKIRHPFFIIENSADQEGKIGSLPEIEKLIAILDSPRVKICLDSAHLFEAGYDLRQTAVVDRLVAELEKRRILPHLVCLHLNDSKTKLNSHHDQHANLGEGEIGLTGLKNFANHPAFAHLPLILEVPGQDQKGPDAVNLALAKSL